MNPTFDLQGHRGARGLRPENTLPSFEAAMDAGVTTVETDLHLTRDGIVVLCHDPYLSPRLFSTAVNSVPIGQLTLRELRAFQADRNPDPPRFPAQRADVAFVASNYAAENKMQPFAVPTLMDLFAFASAYAGEVGREAGKSEERREAARRLRFDLELKRVPFFPEAINDEFNGLEAGLLERTVVETVRKFGLADRVTVRSFDHRSVACLLQLEPALWGAVLVAETAPADPAELARRVGARIYCPAYQFLDRDLVRRCREGGVKVVPWTVNDPHHCRRLLDWGVDGITTDYPDVVAAELLARGIQF